MVHISTCTLKFVCPRWLLTCGVGETIRQTRKFVLVKWSRALIPESDKFDVNWSTEMSDLECPLTRPVSNIFLFFERRCSVSGHLCDPNTRKTSNERSLENCHGCGETGCDKTGVCRIKTMRSKRKQITVRTLYLLIPISIFLRR